MCKRKVGRNALKKRASSGEFILLNKHSRTFFLIFLKPLLQNMAKMKRKKKLEKESKSIFKLHHCKKSWIIKRKKFLNKSLEKNCFTPYCVKATKIISLVLKLKKIYVLFGSCCTLKIQYSVKYILSYIHFKICDDHNHDQTLL